MALTLGLTISRCKKGLGDNALDLCETVGVTLGHGGV